jgi:hypothetical protein
VLLNLADEIDIDEDIIKYIQENKIKNVEIITQVPYGVFLVI